MKDKQIEKLIKTEKTRQKKVINLIASENYVSADVLAALGSELNNKYAEGYPGARYYGGNQVTDQVENLCRERALKVFKLSSKKWGVNVQPLSGSPANLAVYLALVPPGGKVMGMVLAHGGHLTHGHKASASGKFFQPIPYEVSQKTEMIDYDEVAKIAEREKPVIIVAGYTAYPRKIDFKRFRQIADSVGAYLMVDMSHFAGLVAGGAYPSPFPYADIVTTTTHKTLRGPRAAMIFSRKNSARQLPSVSTDTSGNASRGQQSRLTAPRLISDLIDKAVFPGLQGGPHINQIAGVAVALGEAMTPAFKKYAAQVIKNTKALGQELQRLGWRIISGGTDSHLILVDTWLDGKGLGGKEASEVLEHVGVIINKNTIPFDQRSPVDPSGVRLGMAAETTRGATEAKAKEIARKINKAWRRNLSK
jgi:glycine hydroxymethyltransferase